MTKQFYVYIIRDPRPGKNRQPLYVGKGCGRRAYRLSSKNRANNPLLCRTLLRIRNANLKPEIIIVQYFSNEQEALSFEMCLIKRYGRRDLTTGTLCNLSDGGETPLNINAKARQAIADKMSQTSRKLWNDPNYRKMQSQRMQSMNADPMFVAKRNKATSAAMRAKFADPEWRRAFMEIRAKTLSDPKYQSRIAAILQKRNIDPQFRKTLSATLRKHYADNPERRQIDAARAKQMHIDNPAMREYKRNRMLRLNANPEFRAAAAQRLQQRRGDPTYKQQETKRLQRLANDPLLRKANSERRHQMNANPQFKAQMKQLNSDPEFQARRIAAIRRYHAKRKLMLSPPLE